MANELQLDPERIGADIARRLQAAGLLDTQADGAGGRGDDGGADDVASGYVESGDFEPGDTRDDDFRQLADEQRREMAAVEPGSYRELILNVRYGLETRDLNEIKRFLQSRGVAYDTFRQDLMAHGGGILSTRVVTGGICSERPPIPPAA